MSDSEMPESLSKPKMKKSQKDSSKKKKPKTGGEPKAKKSKENIPVVPSTHVDEFKTPLPHANAIFTMNLNQPRGLVAIIEVMSSVLTDCTFSIIPPNHEEYKQTSVSKVKLSMDANRDNFTGLYAECIDSKHCCIVIAKLQGDVLVNSDLLAKEHLDKSKKQDCLLDFCVSVPALLSVIKSINSNYCMQLFRKTGKNSEKLHIKVHSPVMGRHFQTVNVNTLNKERETFDVSDIDYDYTVEFELFELRNIIKMAKGINCEHIRIRIMEHKAPNKKHLSYLVIHIYGEILYTEHCFCSNTDVSEDGSAQEQAGKTMVIKNAQFSSTTEDQPSDVKLDDLKEAFNGIFAVEYLNSFMKALDRHTVVLRLATDRPLIMTSSLGDEESYITFVLAPKENDCNIPNEIQSFNDA